MFTQLLLADEINRTPPKTQAALLEAMAEEQVSSDGETRPLPQPFVVLATDNPIEYEGTYALPEAQLDRFLLRVSLGYLGDGRRAGAAARAGCGTAGRRRSCPPVVDADTVLAMRESLELVQVEPSVLRYVVVAGARLPHAPAGHRRRRARAAGWRWSPWPAARPCSSGRDYVTPEDVKAVAVPALAHRISLRPELWVRRVTSADVVEDLLGSVEVPALTMDLDPIRLDFVPTAAAAPAGDGGRAGRGHGRGRPRTASCSSWRSCRWSCSCVSPRSGVPTAAEVSVRPVAPPAASRATRSSWS